MYISVSVCVCVYTLLVISLFQNFSSTFWYLPFNYSFYKWANCGVIFPIINSYYILSNILKDQYRHLHGQSYKLSFNFQAICEPFIMNWKICLKAVMGWGGTNKWAMDGTLKCAWHPWWYRVWGGFHCPLQAQKASARKLFLS